jgi:glyoxylase-like metal-dependent hydrolase (beta-lactamase superfamily II)
MEVRKIAEGLWRWTAPHPEWTPEKGGLGGWEREGGCVYYEAPDDLVLVDPLVPPEGTPDAAKFWKALDGDVARLGRPIAVLITTRWHGRSAAAIVARYGGARPVRVLVPAAARALVQAPVTGTFRPGETPVAGVVALEADGADGGEVLLWIPQHGAIVAADVLLGLGHGAVRACPPSWLAEGAEGELRHRERLLPSLRRLLDLPIECVVTSHGQPVWTGGRAALAAALGG